MKKVLILLGVLVVLGIGAVVFFIVAVLNAGGQPQKEFFEAVMSGDSKRVTAMFDPALAEEVDEPVLAAWMKAFKDTVGGYDKMSPMDFSVNTNIRNGVKVTECSGTAKFQKGKAHSELTYRNGKLTRFNVKPENMREDWFAAGPTDTKLYRQRGEALLRMVASGKAEDAHAMMHASLRKEVSLDKLKQMQATVAETFGAVRGMKFEREEFNGQAGKLRVRFSVECEKAPAAGDVLFEFVGLKGHILGFNLNKP